MKFNSLKSVTVILPKLSAVLSHVFKPWPRNEMNQSWLCWTQNYRALGNPLGFLSIYHLPRRPSHHLFYHPHTFFFKSSIQVSSISNKFCGVYQASLDHSLAKEAPETAIRTPFYRDLALKWTTAGVELPFNIRIYLKQNSKSLMSFILVRNTV